MFKKIILKNNLRLILAPLDSSNAVTVLIMVGTGSRYESRKLNGISHFLEHMFFKGTKKRPTTFGISAELDKIGAEFNAFTGKETTGFYIKANAKYLDLSLDILSDMLLNSIFDTKEINKERGVILEEMKMIQDTPMHYVSDLFENLLYKGNPLGQMIIGSEKNILNFKQKDFLNYLRGHYVANNMVICVAGNSEKIKKSKLKTEKYFQAANKNFIKEKRSNILRVQSKPNILLHYKKTDQVNFCLGVKAYGLEDKKRFALKLLAVILGGNMSSRLFVEIREKKGMAYYVRTIHEAYVDTGYLVTQVGVDRKNLQKSVKIILKEYKKIVNKGVSNKELQKAKDYIKGISSINLETSDQIANFLTNQEILLGKTSTPKQHFEKIDKVSVRDIQNVAKDIFMNKKLNLAIIGEYKDKKEFEEILKF
ncbi:MAG: pitrilysin family protein [Patescibacteria group bacterium]|nr:pitrilysin family protein [Patescibacteria group bacterium]